ncbi:glyceraldehyde-3-phosphate dehydrogenase, putative [Trypanosoma equiperdum]|uniref:Glyceraldehyde-3-phosphate dehydrogenase, putative n=4 Tax=Trypanozoon TaxID=39700 RepID=Q38E18_TRYB2|nr:glyceraldehyde-3-phosphate dehydrogenase,putative [Trypanosoma brucei gambiense DAL972]XP_827282.1 glyceraldehyde-3-phosphate dehydrogenase, putative [Trypanosoma brucei brucei TREU927]RHW70311.1 glyceraldehyde-3-phosphate dehydrogenase [Trypanosoma brucei equiperdum]SCU72465.1 glyceraldehyde-3-phosphate dehydrogenase, putative [Trypanosoma equiperdum]EAN76952.1 glyceraldehyde-3-phosphate dehydrogenase, putative [Trypanosoma brucei brucei TREU927]CBH14489.1 glyceraldehyde-3-phosphate dehydr|eukprot:XP_011776755.1 glyceraldehyde-3-phosphate dehydrogenase,putative [Trypanosoma brucei gambiense DAL972]
MEAETSKISEVPLPIPIGINGFGAVGRAVLFASMTEPQVTVVAVNDFSVSINYVLYVLQNESPLSAEDKASLTVVGEYIFYRGTERIRVTQKHDLVDIAWRDAGVSYVVECTGFTSTRDRCWGHLTSGARGVLVAGQSGDAPAIVAGVNDSDLSKIQPIICSGAPLAVALAPFIRILHESFGVEDCSYTAIHAIQPVEPNAARSANSQDWRQTRVTLDSITPYAHTGMTTFCKLMPTLSSRITGSAFQVPVTKGCAIDMLLRFKQPVAKESVDEALIEASKDRLKDVLFVSKRDFISRDLLPDGKLCYDPSASQCVREGELYKFTLWFDLERSFAKRLISLIPVMNDADAKKNNV